MSNPKNEEMITVKEAADLSGYNPAHIRKLANEGRITARMLGNMWTIRRGDALLLSVKRKITHFDFSDLSPTEE